MSLNQQPKRWPIVVKCLKCPYHLGLIKCVTSPCKECVLSGRKTNPFEHIEVVRKSKKY